MQNLKYGDIKRFRVVALPRRVDTCTTPITSRCAVHAVFASMCMNCVSSYFLRGIEGYTYAMLCMLHYILGDMLAFVCKHKLRAFRDKCVKNLEDGG